jgi:hypothetical protein
MRLLIDMNLTARWVLFLHNAGHDVVHWSSIGRISAKDSEICDYAREQSYALLTNDLDFLESWRTPDKLLPASSSSGVNRLCPKHAAKPSSVPSRTVPQNLNQAPS